MKSTINLSQDIHTFTERCAETLAILPIYHVTSMSITFMITTLYKQQIFFVLHNISAYAVQSLIRLAQWFPPQVAIPVPALAWIE